MPSESTADEKPIEVWIRFSDEIDGMEVLHDGEVVWQDNGVDLDQYLAWFAPKDRPVLLRYGSDS